MPGDIAVAIPARLLHMVAVYRTFFVCRVRCLWLGCCVLFNLPAWLLSPHTLCHQRFSYRLAYILAFLCTVSPFTFTLCITVGIRELVYSICGAFWVLVGCGRVGMPFVASGWLSHLQLCEGMTSVWRREDGSGGWP